MSLAQRHAHLVLQVAHWSLAHAAIYDDGEAEPVPVRCCKVACQRAYAKHRARLRMHVALCGRATHALSQRAVHACNGQCRQQGVVNVWLAVGEAQQLHFELGTDIVVE